MYRTGEMNGSLRRGTFALTGSVLLLDGSAVLQMDRDVISIRCSLERNKGMGGATYNVARKLTFKMRNEKDMELWSENEATGQSWYNALSSHALDYNIVHAYAHNDQEQREQGNQREQQELRSPQRQVADLRRGARVISGAKMYWINVGRMYHQMMSRPANLRGIASYRRFHLDSTTLKQIPSLEEVINLTVMTWRSGAPYFVSVVETMIHLEQMMIANELFIHTRNWKTTFLSMLDVTQSIHTDGLTLDRVDELWMCCGLSSSEMECRLLWCNDVRQWLKENAEKKGSDNADYVSTAMYEQMLLNIQSA